MPTLFRFAAAAASCLLVIDGKIVDGIGVSGVTSEQDGVVAKAGADALSAK